MVDIMRKSFSKIIFFSDLISRSYESNILERASYKACVFFHESLSTILGKDSNCCIVDNPLIAAYSVVQGQYLTNISILTL